MVAGCMIRAPSMQPADSRTRSRKRKAANDGRPLPREADTSHYSTHQPHPFRLTGHASGSMLTVQTRESHKRHHAGDA